MEDGEAQIPQLLQLLQRTIGSEQSTVLKERTVVIAAIRIIAESRPSSSVSGSRSQNKK
jgi:hypothetical protein